MTKSKDDLEALRAVVAALEGFSASDQERIIRWAREKLGLDSSPATLRESRRIDAPTADTSGSPQAPSGRDLRTFVTEKNPSSDVQFAATVAYYYQFEAPAQQRKNEIGSQDLQEACRLVNRERLASPGQTLRNAHHLGLLDKGSASGLFSINSVGENLVAMTLPRKSGEKPPGKIAKKNTKVNVGKKQKKTSRN